MISPANLFYILGSLCFLMGTLANVIGWVRW